jgi:sugar (pentulose or hexulose) kinase
MMDARLVRAVDAVCLSGNGPTLVPVEGLADGGGEALPPLHWFSPLRGGRVADGGAGGGRGPGEKSLFLPYAARFRDASPDLYSKTALFLPCSDWLSARLGAEPVSALPTALYQPYYYDDAQCADRGLDRRKFPPFALLGTRIGKVSAEAARRSGCLATGVPIAAGGPDFITAIFGSGAVSPGLVCDRAGSSEGINVCATEPPSPELASANGLRVLPHAVEGLWNVSAMLPQSGSLIDRYRDEAGQRDIPYEETLRLLGAGGGRGLHPVLRQVADGVAGALARLEAAGYPAPELRHSGGQAKSPLWNRLKARACARVLLIPRIRDTELAGCAASALAALGVFPSPVSAARAIAVIEERVEPMSD